MLHTNVVNLGGSLFHLERKAYQQLEQYFAQIRIRYAVVDGGEDILKDIELSLADKLRELVTNGHSIITDSDIHRLIVALGRVEQFEDNELIFKELNVQEQKGNSKSKSRIENGISLIIKIKILLQKIMGAVLVLGGSGLGIILTVLGGIFLFSPYDLPVLQTEVVILDIMGWPLYILGILSGYFTLLGPMLLFIVLGTFLLLRKVFFTTRVARVLIAIWIVIVSGFSTITTYTFPKIVQASHEANSLLISMSVTPVPTFEEIVISGPIQVNIKKGEQYAVEQMGRKLDISNLTTHFNAVTKTFYIGYNKVCLYCVNNNITVDIVLPKPNSLTITNGARVSIDGFDPNSFLFKKESTEGFDT